MSDIVTRLWGNTGDKYPGFQNLNTEAAAEITRLRNLIREEQEKLRARLVVLKAELEAGREHDTMEREPDEDIEHWFARRDIARIKIKKARAAVDAIEKNAS